MPSVLSETLSLLGTVPPDGTLPRLDLTVTFLGRLPEALDIRNIVSVHILYSICCLLNCSSQPIQIAISVPQDVGAHAYPIVKIHQGPETGDDDVGRLSVDDQNLVSVLTTQLESDSNTNASQIRSNIANSPPPFLPLPSSFCSSRRRDWVDLYMHIAEWMVRCIRDRNSKAWEWAQDAYWIAFVAAYPNFPHGEWPMWDYKVALGGAFIKGWMEQKEEGPYGWQGLRQEGALLARFREHVSFVL